MTAREYFVRIGEDEDFEVRIRREGDRTVVSIDGQEWDADLERIAGAEFSARLDGVVHRFEANRAGDDDGWILALDGREVAVRVETERERRIRRSKKAVAGPSGPRDVTSDMAGIVVQVLVSEGQAVEAGAALVVVEAMKMENEIRAGSSGTVTSIHITDGDTVAVGDVLVSLG